MKLLSLLDVQFNPHRSFIALPIVWIVTLAIIITSSICAFLIVVHTPLRWDLSAAGFNNFVSVFRFPLGILALIIPIIALLAANHRSEQTKEQIRVTNQQNTFSNHYKHLEEFKKYVDILQLDDFDDVLLRKLHKKMFPRSLNGEMSLDLNVAVQFTRSCNNIIDTLNKDSSLMGCTQALNECNYIYNDLHLRNSFKLPEVSKAVALKIIDKQLSLIYLVLMFAHDCHESVEVSYRKARIEVNKALQLKQAS
ncbi:hypothetical protein A6D97_09505 [Vibrio sp. ZF57]|nr:hypothetical protein A6D97_09505 [Vibrio sp. ZF57]